MTRSIKDRIAVLEQDPARKASLERARKRIAHTLAFRRAQKPCLMGVGCEEAGVCYALAHGDPDQCGKL